MQSERPSAGQWTGGPAEMATNGRPPVTVSGTTNPQEFYYRDHGPILSGSGMPAPPSLQLQPPREPMQSTYVRKQLRAASGPASSANHTLNSVKSTPVLANRPAGSVKNMANKFDQGGAPNGVAQAPQLTVRTTHDRYKRSGGSKSPAQKSPTREGVTKLLKRRPRSPAKSPPTSFEGSSSFGSTTTLTSTKSQPQTSLSPNRPEPQSARSYMKAGPLFGEITADGKWNGK